IGGGVSNVGEPLFNALQNYIGHYALNPKGSEAPGMPAKLKQDARVIGGAAAWFERYYIPSSITKVLCISKIFAYKEYYIMEIIMTNQKHIHIISHTHWDREWYLPYEKHHMKLIDLMDTLLETLKTDSNYRSFHLDGQTIILDDYL